MDSLNCIELTLKTPNQRIDDIRLMCQEDWTVKRLKEHLETVYPSKPKCSAQKLIYLGKLLQDHVLLKEIFSNLSATLHIVCQENQTDSQSACSSQTTASNSAPNSSSSSHNDSQNTEGIRYRGQQQAEPSVPLPMTQQLPNNATQQQQQQYHQLWNQQYQMQMQQYYMQMQQWQQVMSSGQWPYQQTNMYNHVNSPAVSPSLPGTPPVTPSTPNIPQAPPPEQAEQGQMQQQQPEANRNVPMNAGPGGAIMQDDGNGGNNPANRDWLDWLYMSMRGLMLMSIIYFYSSTSRFMLVAILGFIIYLYQTGWFTPRRVPQVEVPAPQINQNEGADGNQVNTDQHENNTTELNNENAQPQTPVEPPRPSAFRILCTFVISFVTSLIPASAPPLQQN